MGRSRVDLDIIVGRRTIQIGYQVFQLRNVARISLAQIDARPMEVFIRLMVELIAGSALIVGAYAGFTSAVVQMPISDEDVQLIAVMLFLALAAIYLARVMSLALKRTVFIFAMDTAGGPGITLASEDKGVTGQLMQLVRNAIEYPPDTTTVHRIENIVIGDQINQAGGGLKIGKQVFNG